MSDPTADFTPLIEGLDGLVLVAERGGATPKEIARALRLKADALAPLEDDDEYEEDPSEDAD